MIKYIRKIIFAILICCAVSFIFIYVLQAGKQLQSDKLNAVISPVIRHDIIHEFYHTLSLPIAIFISQLIIILIASQVFGYLFKKIGQPSVMGEIVAGIVLGSSVMGALFPAFTVNIFPMQSLGNLQILSQVGLLLFMFVIGIELDFNLLKNKTGSALLISFGGIILPYTLGIILAYYLYQTHSPDNIKFYEFALFIGIAMSITAFPVLARIIRERDLSNTKLGIIAITSAAAGDITGWCLLAIIIAVIKAGSLTIGLYTLAIAIVYVWIMLIIVRGILKKIPLYKPQSQLIRQPVIVLVFIIMLLSAYCAEIIGIHALFGAFLAGAIMPQEWNFRKIIIGKIEDVALVLLLPLFFVLTGLRTQIGLLNSAALWGTCMIIILVAVVGKFAGSAIMARLAGETVHDSLAIGALMNTRGLMEIIILNIGYDLGILSPQIFTMMIIMALITTFMTGPLLNIIDRYVKR